MEEIYRCKTSGLAVFSIRGLGAERDQAEREVVDAGVPLPLFHRAVWSSNHDNSEPWFLLVRDADGRASAGVTVEQIVTRAMPGHRIFRLRQFGNGMPYDVCRVLLEGLAELVRKSNRILQIQVRVFSRCRRNEFSQLLALLGYRELVPPSVYRHTLVLDLKPSEEEIFAKINKSGRQSIRKTMKMALKSVPLTSPEYANRLGELQREALQRTGGHIASEDWRAVLNISKERPDLSRVFGLFLGENESPENMMAFGWVCSHGDHGEYRSAGSTRRSDLKIPYGYAVVWDMIRWSKAAGAEWFDLGGVTLNEGDKDPLKGISDFKRCFRGDVEEVGAEWVFDQHPIRARLANVLSKNAQRLRGRMSRKR